MLYTYFRYFMSTHIIFDCNCPYRDISGEECYCTAYDLFYSSVFTIDYYSYSTAINHDIYILNSW